MTSSSEIIPAPPVFQVALFTPTPKAAKRVLEFFTAQINNDHTRKAYMNATRRFAEWRAGRRYRRIGRRSALPRCRLRQAPAGGMHAAHGEAAPGRAPLSSRSKLLD